MAPAVAPVSADIDGDAKVDKVVAADFVAEDEIGLEGMDVSAEFAANIAAAAPEVLEAPVAGADPPVAPVVPVAGTNPCNSV